ELQLNSTAAAWMQQFSRGSYRSKVCLRIEMQVDSDSGDDEEQKAAIALIRKKEAEQQQRQLQDENKLHQAGFPDAESVAGNDCGSKEGTHEAAAKQQDSAAAEAPLRGALESAEAQEKENALLPQNSRETAAKSEKPP